MKTLKNNWIAILLIALLMQGLSSCKNGQSPQTVTGHVVDAIVNNDIQGTWLEPNPIKLSESQGMILKEDGSAQSVGMATLIFKNWILSGDTLFLASESIGNKQTIIATDTLRVVKLNADSLVLSLSGEIVWRLSREKK